MSHRNLEGTPVVRRVLIFTTAVLLALAGWFVIGDPDAVIADDHSGSDKVLATVNGKTVTKAEVLEQIAPRIMELDRQRHEAIEEAVEGRIQALLMESMAEKKGITTEQLIAQEVEGKKGEVTAEAVDAFYEARKAQIRQPKEQVEDRIRSFLAYEAFRDRLSATGSIDRSLEPFRVEVAATGARKGPDNAPITIIEFSDFQCPYCSRVNPTIEQVKAKYGDKIALVFRHFPLSFHAEAPKASEAALCADDQGKFWEMHDALFADQQNLKVDGLRAKAEGLQLDMAAFNACLDSSKYAETVQRDLREGSAVGVSGTPAFFINGRFLSGAAPLENFTTIIDDELDRMGVSTESK